MAWGFDAITAIRAVKGADTLSGSHTTSGSDRTLVVGVSWVDEGTTVNEPSVSSVTYNGVAATFRVRARHQYAGNTRSITTEIWTLDDPATGSNTLSVTLSEGVLANNQLMVLVGSYTGTQGVGTNFGSTAAQSQTMTATVDTDAATSVLVGFGGMLRARGDRADMWTAGTGDTERDEDSCETGATDYSVWFGDTPATGGSDTISATTAESSSRYSFVAVELLEASGGGGSQDIAPSFISSAATVPNPTVSAGATTVAPNFIASAESVPSPTLSAGATTVAPSFIASTATVPGPTVSAGATTVAPNFIASGETVPNPTLTPGSTTVAPNFISSGETVYSPTVSMPSNNTYGSAVYGTDVYDSVSAQDIAPSFIASGATVPSPTVGAGATNIDAAFIPAGAQVFAPSLAAGSVDILVDRIESTLSVFSPTLTTGVATIAPEFIPSGVVFYTATVSTPTSAIDVANTSTGTIDVGAATSGLIDVATAGTGTIL